MKYIDLSIHHKGRLSRGVFWRTFVLLFVTNIVIDTIEIEGITDQGAYMVILFIVNALFCLPYLSLIARRFQDTAFPTELKHAFMCLFVLLIGLCCVDWKEDTPDDIPEWLGGYFFLYFVALIICCSRDSQPGSNMWGDNPKGIQEKAPLNGAKVIAASVEAGGSSQVCPCCCGGGRNAAGCICPHCGGSGVMSENMS